MEEEEEKEEEEEEAQPIAHLRLSNKTRLRQVAKARTLAEARVAVPSAEAVAPVRPTATADSTAGPATTASKKTGALLQKRRATVAVAPRIAASRRRESRRSSLSRGEMQKRQGIKVKEKKINLSFFIVVCPFFICSVYKVPCFFFSPPPSLVRAKSRKFKERGRALPLESSRFVADARWIAILERNINSVSRSFEATTFDSDSSKRLRTGRENTNATIFTTSTLHCIK